MTVNRTVNRTAKKKVCVSRRVAKRVTESYRALVNQAVKMGSHLPKASNGDWPIFNKE